MGENQESGFAPFCVAPFSSVRSIDVGHMVKQQSNGYH
jgi:hypothetical protein